MIKNSVDSSNEESFTCVSDGTANLLLLLLPSKHKIFDHSKDEKEHFPHLFNFPVIIPKQTLNEPYKRCLTLIWNSSKIH